MIAVLAGGVGAARFLRGLFAAMDQRDVVVIGNVGDDLELYGLHISPDLDTVTYTTSGHSNEVTGWGLEGETWTVMGAVKRFGVEPWFNLGDVDLATHLYRTSRLHEGASLSQVTAEITKSFGLSCRLIPMSDDPVRTRLALADGREVDFQEYFVRLHHDVEVVAVRILGAAEARPAPGVIEALRAAETVIVAPSNPILSIGPILAMPTIASALRERRESVVAISPIIGGSALKGPADRLLVELGHESSATGVARVLEPYIATMVIDNVDAALAIEVEACGVAPVVTDTIMSDLAVARSLAEVALAAGGRRTDLR